MGINIAYRKPDELPATLAVFPLSGALLLPRGQLPLNIFEPRYMAMIDDALRGERVIGIIQPEMADAGSENARLFSVGCSGKITQFAETGDGRYVLQLTGVARFRVISELTVMTPYRQCQVDYTPFIVDFTARAGESDVDRASVVSTLRRFIEANDLSVDWDGVDNAPNEALVNALAMMSPFGPPEKQALLEAPDLRSRAEMLIAITELELARRSSDGTETPLQ